MKRIRLVNPFKELIMSKGKKFAMIAWAIMVLTLMCTIFFLCKKWELMVFIFAVMDIIYVKMIVIDFAWYPEFIDDDPEY